MGLREILGLPPARATEQEISPLARLILRYPALAASNLAKGGLEGVGSIGTAQDYLQRGVDWLAAPALGPEATPGSRLSSAALVDYGRAAGLIDRPDLQPQNSGERYVASIAEGVGSALPYSSLSVGGGLPLLLRGALPGAIAGAGGEYAAQLVPDYATLARMAGNKTMSGAVTLGSRPASGTATSTILEQNRERLQNEVNDSDTVAFLRRLADTLTRPRSKKDK